MAYRIVGRVPSGAVPERDEAVGAFMRVIDNLDVAVRNLAAHVSGPHSARLGAAQARLEEAYTHLREALICSAVDFRQPGTGRQVRAMQERYPVLPNRWRLAQGSPAGLAETSFPPGSVIEAISQPAARSSAERASHRPLPRPRPMSAP
jgi:hypothetical protein